MNFEQTFQAHWQTVARDQEPTRQANDDITQAARQLLAWDEWDNRHADDGDGYAWGFKTQACRFLWDADLEGRWDAKTSHALERAEELAQVHEAHTKTTTNDEQEPIALLEPPPQPPDPVSSSFSTGWDTAPGADHSPNTPWEATGNGQPPDHSWKASPDSDIITLTIQDIWLLAGITITAALGGFLVGFGL
jgi:hypothetical protein